MQTPAVRPCAKGERSLDRLSIGANQEGEGVGCSLNDDGWANEDAFLLPLNFRDQTALSLGAAYQTGKWTLRMGARFTTQAVPTDTMLAVMPAITTRFGSAGFSYQFSPTSKVDVAWNHSFKKKMDNASLPNTSAPIRVEHAQDDIGLAYTYSF